jgi:hypothetical protein
MPRAQEQAGQVHGEHLLPFRERDVERMLAHRDAGVVDQDVHRADLPEDRFYGIFLRNIRDQHARRRILVDARDPGARLLQQVRRRLADAARSAGDGGRFAFQVEKFHGGASIGACTTSSFETPSSWTARARRRGRAIWAFPAERSLK